MTPSHRKCNHPEHEGPSYLPVEAFHRKGYRKGRQQYSTRCKVCVNRDYRKEYWETGKTRNDWKYKKAYIRARSKALTRLSKLVPELYEKCLHEELMKEPDYAEGRSKIGKGTLRNGTRK
jgi:hypothetical protein